MKNEEGTDFPHGDPTSRIIGCAIEVHRALGPGVLESFYQKALAIEMSMQGLGFSLETPFPVHYKERFIGEHRADFDVERLVLLEIKAVESVLPIHCAIAYSYLKVSRRPVLLIINFHEPVLKDGIHRLVMTRGD